MVKPLIKIELLGETKAAENIFDPEFIFRLQYGLDVIELYYERPLRYLDHNTKKRRKLK
jgi:hypothetical protein